MPPLDSGLRNDLESVVKKARVSAEAGAKESLQTLRVHEAKSSGLSDEQRSLRTRLRAHGRQLGDVRSTNGEQEIARLIRECAYEHWHRMLFARFLAENELLIHPEHGVAVSLEDVEELAREEGLNPWALASRFAQGMLPQIFRPDDPVLAVMLPTERRLELEQLLESLPPATFTADDSLGWVYQFWQAAEKDAVNARVKSGEKITGETLPAVTQLFTEHYMVLFLLHNTIGAWHAGKVLAERPDPAANAKNEQEVRDVVRLTTGGGYDFEYLRFVREAKEGEDLNEGTGPWRPAAGTYDGWPRTATELRVLDPCCGSGHFLVASLDLLVRLRITEEGLDAEAAIAAVLTDNLFGLELDPRCTQIAAFNVALAAWKLAGKAIELPRLKIACSGIGPQSTKEEWLALIDRSGPTWQSLPAEQHDPVIDGLFDLHGIFSLAPELGSLIDPSDRETDLITADFETLHPFLERILAAESADYEAHERAVAARGMAAAAEILAGNYTLVITNVPYLGRGSQSDLLKAFAEANYKDAKSDLATIFVARMFRWAGGGTDAGTIAAVTPQNWLFLTSYKKLRERLLKARSWNIVARLGPGAFETIGGHVVNVALLGITGGKAGKGYIMAGVDVSANSTAAAKAALLRGVIVAAASLNADSAASSDDEPDTRPDLAEPPDGTVHLTVQSLQLRNPGTAITTRGTAGDSPRLGEYADCYHGVTTTDYSRFGRTCWELSLPSDRWRTQQSTVDATTMFGGRSAMLLWEDDGREVREMRDAGATVVITGIEAWGTDGIAISQMSSLSATRYTGDTFDTNVAIVVPKRYEDLPAIWAFLSSPDFSKTVRRFNTKVVVEYVYYPTMPFDRDHWKKVATEQYLNGLPEPQSDDPTQWLFHGRPEHAEVHAVLQVAVGRLIGYRWPAELDEDMRLAAEARELVRRCAELAEHADDDGIVCLAPVRGEASAADRLRRLLADAYGEAWSPGRERELLAAAAEFHKQKMPSSSLEDWFVERFFEEHCRLFHHRPFVWHIWDGRKDGFQALVNYHKLAAPDGAGRQLLTTLTHSYLGDWIRDQKDQVSEDKAGAEARLTAALELQDELEKILDGEPPYDIFVRWKPLHEQPIGWEPDINDGVRLNIRPFMMAKDVGRKGAGILRWKPNIKWGKDRGKEPKSLRPKAEFPWFWNCDPEKNPGHQENFTGGDDFDGNRWNNLHYTNAFKQAARDRHAAEGSS